MARKVRSTDVDEVLPGAVSDALVDEVVTTLNGWGRDAGFAFARRAGALIVEKFYGGDVVAWRERGVRDGSFRKLAARCDEGALHLSASALCRCVQLVELEDRLGARDWAHLTVSHVRQVFGLREQDQRKLLDRAEDRRWSVDETHTAALKLRAKYEDGRGRPPLPMFVKSIRRMDRLFVEDDPSGEIDKLDEGRRRTGPPSRRGRGAPAVRGGRGASQRAHGATAVVTGAPVVAT